MISVLVLAVSLACCRVDGSSKGKGEVQVCRSTAPDTYGKDEFLCPVDQQCKPANQRCLGPSSEVCKSSTSVEQGCAYDSTSKSYQFYLGRSPVSSSSSLFGKRRKRSAWRCIELWWHGRVYHNFVDYRGFTFEFGGYGVQILDQNDPAYKYAGGKDVQARDYKGNSDCTYDELRVFVNYWDGDYSLCDNNCQDFAAGLTRVLSTNCAMIRADSKRNKRDAKFLSNALINYFFQITVGNCTRRDGEGASDSPSGGVATETSVTRMYYVVAIMATVVSARGL